MRSLSAPDIIQNGVAVTCWLGLLLWSAWPFFFPESWPLKGAGWNIRRHHRVWLLLLLVSLLAWRAPELMFNEQYNADESQLLAGAHRLSVDPVAWRSVDGGTAGPADFYVLLWAVPFGIPFSYFEARLTGIFCLFVMLYFLLKSAELILGRRRAPLVAFVAATFYLLASKTDLVHYSTEHLPIALLSASCWCVVVLWRKPRRPAAFFLGFCLGAISLAKLQAAPIAAYIFAVAVALLVADGKPFARAGAWRERIFLMLCLGAGSLIVPGAILIPVMAAGGWSDFLYRYLGFATHYGVGLLLTHPPSRLHIAVVFLWQVFYLAGGCLGFCALLIGARVYRGGWPGRTWWLGMLVAAGYLVISAGVILWPGTPFRHYVHFLPGPLVLTLAWTLRMEVRESGGPGVRFSARTLAVLLIVLCILPQTIDYARLFPLRPELSDVPDPDPVTKAILAVTQKGDTLCVWGWAPEYYVQTGLLSATRDVVAPLMEAKEGDYYRKTFVSDLEKSKPRVFLDACGHFPSDGEPNDWPHPVEKARYTMYAPLAAYIDAHYHLEETFPISPSLPPVLLFIANDPGR